LIDLRLEDQLVDLVGEGVDVAVRAGSPPPDSTSVVAHPVFRMRRVLVAAPRWLRRHGAIREPAQLSSRPCLLQVTPGGVAIRWSLVEEGGSGEPLVVDVEGQLRTNAPSALRDLALSGAGVAYLPDWLVAADLENGTLKRVLPKWSSAPLTAWAIYRAELRGAPRLRAFLDALPSSASELSAVVAR
jgi:DNA-binding transcriptional LysR family regulator